MREQDGQDGERTERKSKERGILIGGAIIGQARSLALGKFPGNPKDDPNKDPKHSWRGYLK